LAAGTALTAISAAPVTAAAGMTTGSARTTHPAAAALAYSAVRGGRVFARVVAAAGAAARRCTDQCGAECEQGGAPEATAREPRWRGGALL
jgi:hypothetical protein